MLLDLLVHKSDFFFFKSFQYKYNHLQLIICDFSQIKLLHIELLKNIK